MLISLTGFMGCGKSSVGRKLSELLCCPFVDLDEMIVQTHGRTIPEIFESEGEAAFRRMEADALCSLLEDKESTVSPGSTDAPNKQSSQQAKSVGQVSTVLALGGGTVMTQECAEVVREKTLCIYLRASVDTLVNRLESESSGRPMLHAGSPLRVRTEDLMSRRSATYEKTARIIIDTDGKSIEDIASEIIIRLDL